MAKVASVFVLINCHMHQYKGLKLFSVKEITEVKAFQQQPFSAERPRAVPRWTGMDITRNEGAHTVNSNSFAFIQ